MGLVDDELELLYEDIPSSPTLTSTSFLSVSTFDDSVARIPYESVQRDLVASGSTARCYLGLRFEVAGVTHTFESVCLLNGYGTEYFAYPLQGFAEGASSFLRGAVLECQRFTIDESAFTPLVALPVGWGEPVVLVSGSSYVEVDYEGQTFEVGFGDSCDESLTLPSLNDTLNFSAPLLPFDFFKNSCYIEDGVQRVTLEIATAYGSFITPEEMRSDERDVAYDEFAPAV